MQRSPGPSDTRRARSCRCAEVALSCPPAAIPAPCRMETVDSACHRCHSAAPLLSATDSHQPQEATLILVSRFDIETIARATSSRELLITITALHARDFCSIARAQPTPCRAFTTGVIWRRLQDSSVGTQSHPRMNSAVTQHQQSKIPFLTLF